MNKHYKIITYIFFIILIVLSGSLVVYLIGKEKGDYNLGLFIPIVFGALCGLVINFLHSKWHKKRNGNVPEVDERSLLLMKNYLLIVLYFVLIGSSALLLLLYLMGIHTIETGILIVYMMILYMLIGMGTIVVKRL